MIGRSKDNIRRERAVKGMTRTDINQSILPPPYSAHMCFVHAGLVTLMLSQRVRVGGVPALLRDHGLRVLAEPSRSGGYSDLEVHRAHGHKYAGRD